jgi:hypothetical protein
MANEPVSGELEKHFLTSKPLISLILVILLSLATWSYFYVMQMPLTPAETSFIVGFWLLVVFGVKWMFGRRRRNKTENS